MRGCMTDPEQLAMLYLAAGLVAFAQMAHGRSRASRVSSWCLGATWIVLAVGEVAPVDSMLHDVLPRLSLVSLAISVVCFIGDWYLRSARSRAKPAAV